MSRKKKQSKSPFNWVKINLVPATVFVFLDEGLPNLPESNGNIEPIEVGEIPGYKIKVIPLPWLLRGLGIFDFQIVFYLQKLIFSDKYPIKSYLSHWPQPRFFFFTSDQNFILDVVKGFESYKKPVRRGIEIMPKSIKFKGLKNDEEVLVNITSIGGKVRLRDTNICSNIIQKLQTLLPAI